jgi:demethylspheroidene O-methyltransferase
MRTRRRTTAVSKIRSSDTVVRALQSVLDDAWNYDDASALSLLRAVRRALSTDGTLLIAEAMSGVRGTEPLDAYYGFYTLAMGRGEPRTAAEIGRLLRHAGFGRFRLLRNRMPILTSILVARPTSSSE